MTNDELKKKIVDVLIKVDEYVRNEIIKATEEHKAFLTGDNQYYYIVADALIAAEIGDVKEVEYQVKVLKRALRMTVSKIEYLQFQISTRQECPISVPDIEDEDCEPYVRRAEDELLFEEEKLKGGER